MSEVRTPRPQSISTLSHISQEGKIYAEVVAIHIKPAPSLLSTSMASLCPRSLSGAAIRTIAPSGQPSSMPLRCLHHTARPHATRPSFHSYSETHHLHSPKFSCSSSSRHHQSRTFTSYPARLALKTVQQARARQRSGPFSAAAAIVFFASGAGLVVYFRYEKARMERKRIAEATKGVGKPKIGGTFDLVDQEGRGFGDGDMKGGFSIVSVLSYLP